MGLFSSKKTTLVSSTVYNIAGVEEDRPQFLQNTVVGSVLANRASIAETVTGAYRNGPGIRFRTFARWARTSGYNAAIGQVSSQVNISGNIDSVAVGNQIPRSAGNTVIVEEATLDLGNYSYWVEQYIATHHPGRLNTAYTADINELTNQITITFADTTTASFLPSNYERFGSYLFATYREATPETASPVVYGPSIGGAFPSTAGWTLVGNSSNTVNVSLETRTVTAVSYSDGSPGSTTSSSTFTASSYTNQYETWYKVENISGTYGVDGIFRRKYWMYLDTGGSVATSSSSTSSTVEVSEGVFQTTTTTTYTDSIVYHYAHRIDTQDVQRTWSHVKVFIYKRATGNATLDAMWAGATNAGQFFPFIPIRVNNAFISDTSPGDLYPKTKTALRRATGGNLNKIVDEVAGHASLPDIDFVYAVFGVSLNVQEQACRKYVYNFFKYITQGAFLETSAEFEAWKVGFEQARQSQIAWANWRDAVGAGGLDLAGTEPTIIPYSPMPVNMVRITSDKNTAMNYHMEVVFNYVSEESGTGLLKVGAKRDELWFEIGAAEEFSPTRWMYDENTGTFKDTSTDATRANLIILNWQVNENEWKRLRIRGLKHRNIVYGGKAVEIEADDALNDTNESGFIIPLHEELYKTIGIKDGTQMATASMFLVFNSYEVKKTPWYASGFFKILVIVVVIAVSVWTGGAGLGAGVGLLGSNAAVGAAMGFAAGSAAAAVAGAIANALVAMIVSTIISKVSTALFGEEIGAIVGAIASFVVVSLGPGMIHGGSFSASFGELMKADKLLDLTMAAGKGIGGYMQGSAAETALETRDFLEGYEAEYESISKQMNQLLGGASGINPMMFVDGFQSLGSAETTMVEPIDLFLKRTLMMGTDIADISLSMIGNFTQLTVNTDLPIIDS